MPKGVALYRLEWDPSPRLIEEIRRRGYSAPWEMPYEAWASLKDALTLAEGRSEFDRWARALHAEGDLRSAMDAYHRDFAYEIQALVNQYRNVDPERKVAIYRAVPRPAPNVIRPGDWVSLERRYAASHGSAGYRDAGGSKVVSAMVPAKDVAWAGTSADEWLFAPREFRAPDVGVHEALVEYARAQGFL